MKQQKIPLALSMVSIASFSEGAKNVYIFNNMDRLFRVGIGINPTDQSFFCFAYIPHRTPRLT